MKNILSKETLQLISVCGIIETILRLPRNSDDYFLLNTVFEENKKSIIIRRNCKACKKNFEPGGSQCVCEVHYHDYCDCRKENCLFCLLVRSIGFSSSIGFNEVDRIYAEGTEEEKQYVKGIMDSANIVYELTPNALIAKAVTTAGDTVISSEAHENKMYLVYEDKEADGIFIVVFDVSGGERRQIYRRRIEILPIKKIEG